MAESIVVALLVNAYWFSLPFIGHMILLFLAKATHPFGRARYLAGRILEQHIFIVALVSFGLVSGVFAVVSLPLYLLNASTGILTGIYIGLLGASLVYGAYLACKNMFTKKSLDIFRLSSQPLFVKLIFLLLGLLLAVDFALSLYVKSYALGDTLYHLARMVAIVNDGFTIASGHFGQLLDTAYHHNILYGLYAVAANVLGIPPVEIYKLSLGFFRLLQWLTVFTLMWYVAKCWLKSKGVLLLSSLATIFTMCFLSGALFVATYPNKLIGVWIVLFIISLSLYESGIKKAAAPLMGMSLLITMTHANAVMVVLFMGLYMLYWVCTKGLAALKDRARMSMYMCVVGILSLGPLVTAMIPGHLTDDQMRLGEFPVIHIAGMMMRDPVAELSSKSLMEQVFLLIGIVGTVYILARVWKNVRQRQLVLALSTFYIFIMYVPPVFTLVNQVLPMWAMDRFSSMNILGLVLVPIGVYAIVDFLASSAALKKRLSAMTRSRGRDIALALFVLGLAVLVAVPGYSKLTADRQRKVDTYSQLSGVGKDFASILNGNKVVLANLKTSYLLPAALNIDVVAVHLGHSTSSADTANRLACHKYMMGSLEYNELLYTKVNFVVLDKKSDGTAIKQLADAKPYLKMVAEDKNYYVYAVKRGNTQPGRLYAACSLYQERESGK